MAEQKRVYDLEQAASEQAADLWTRGRLVLYSFFTASALKFINIHNELLFVMGSLLMLIFFYFLKAAGKNLPYAATGLYLYQLADLAIALFQIFIATSIGIMANSFLTADGAFNVRGANKIIILLFLIFGCILTLPKHFRVPIAPVSCA